MRMSCGHGVQWACGCFFIDITSCCSRFGAVADKIRDMDRLLLNQDRNPGTTKSLQVGEVGNRGSGSR